LAARYGRLEIVKYLVQQGANTEALITNNDNMTPLQLATQFGRTSCIHQYLEKHRRFRQLIVHDTREYLTRLGLFSVERDAIISFFTSDSINASSDTGADDLSRALSLVTAVRTEFAGYVATLSRSSSLIESLIDHTSTSESSSNKKRKRSK